ncbi:pIIIa [Frog adenovirus 1]|uniref:PIIIa n=1 Tax=Frog adenovirus 1 (strain ATCC VR-896) TaxID=114102 RepID=Q9III0_ADEF1|nr:pIIIa [Frog adenovirus 1]AAF86927.1 pIIIa [Frog adenovirus 1]
MDTKEFLAHILAGQSPNLTREFQSLPLSYKIVDLEKAIVEPKKSDTPNNLAKIVRRLVEIKAIYPDEASTIYDRLLSRMMKFNSIRHHNALDSLVQEVQVGQKQAILDKIKEAPTVSNMTVLQHFYDTLPPTVEKGQQNYDVFKNLLRQFVLEYHKYVVIFKSGSDVFLQFNYGPQIERVNLTQAFQTLQNLWGVQVVNRHNIPSLTAMLSPQTRLLLLLVAPLSQPSYFSKNSFLEYLMTVYKQTLGGPVDGETVAEIDEVITSLGPSYNKLGIRSALNFLVTNQEKKFVPEVQSLSQSELGALRFIQKLLRTKITGRRPLKQRDLDNVFQGLDMYVFGDNILFVNRLFDYFTKVLQTDAGKLNHIIMDPTWTPPPMFFVKEVLIPQDLALPDSPPASRRGLPPPPPPVAGPFSDTEDDDDDVIPPLYDQPRNPVAIDVESLSAAFSKLKGKGELRGHGLKAVSSSVLARIRSVVRQMGLRPY